MSKKGRNDLCSCGSGKKYKKCCLNNKKAFENFADLLSNEVNDFRITFNDILNKEHNESKDYIKSYYERIDVEAQKIITYMKNTPNLKPFELTSLNYYVATYYSTMANIYHAYRTFFIVENKIKKGITFGDNNDLVCTTADNETRMYKKKFELSEKSNKYFTLALNQIKSIVISNDDRFSQLFFSINVNSFNNLAIITPLLSILLIENFENELFNYANIDFYNKIMLSISYIHAYEKYLEYANHGFESLISAIKKNCNYRLTLIIYDLANAYKKMPKQTENIIRKLVNEINQHIDNKITFEKLISRDIKLLELNVNVTKKMYVDIKTAITEFIGSNLFGQTYDMHLLWNELAHNITNNFTTYENIEKLYKISQSYNIIDKISYAIIQYTNNSTINKKFWDFKRLLEHKIMEDYNEPNFRQVIAFTKILNNFNNKSYFNEIKNITEIRHSVTHKPIDINDYDFNDKIDELKRKMDIYNLVYLVLATTAIEIDMRSKVD